MDSRKPPQPPEHLLDDLESIRQLLGQDHLEPPLLTDSIDPNSIPLLSEVVAPAPRPSPAPAKTASTAPPPPRPTAPAPPPPRPAVEAAPPHSPASTAQELQRIDSELRAAAQLILQDVIDDFVPQIEAELRRRLEARLDRILAQRKK